MYFEEATGHGLQSAVRGLQPKESLVINPKFYDMDAASF
jgi:hypothetical protein